MVPVTQPWTHELPLMQQTVLLEVIRGPDTVAKYEPVKYLLGWYRRCVLVTAFERTVLSTPYALGGGSFTGPSITVTCSDIDQPWEERMDELVGETLRGVDALPHHFWMHLIHAIEILGYKHPDPRIRAWWQTTYVRFVHDLHLWPETEEELDRRLGDDPDGWRARADAATLA